MPRVFLVIAVGTGQLLRRDCLIIAASSIKQGDRVRNKTKENRETKKREEERRRRGTALGLPASQLKKKKIKELHWVSQRVDRRRRRRVNCTGSPRSPKVKKKLFGFWFGSSKHRKQNWRRTKKGWNFPHKYPPLLKKVNGQLTRCSSYNYFSYPTRTNPFLVLQCPFTEAKSRVEHRFEPKQLEPKGYGTFSGRKQNLYSFLFTLPKVAPLHPGFSLSIFQRKITEIDRAVIPPKWLDWNLIRHNFSNLGTFPCTPPNND